MKKREWNLIALKENKNKKNEISKRSKKKNKVRDYFETRRKKTKEIGELLNTKEEKIDRWIRYIEKLYENKTLMKRFIEREDKVKEEEIGDLILRLEFNRVPKEMKTSKTTGVDDVAYELLKNSGGFVHTS